MNDNKTKSIDDYPLFKLFVGEIKRRKTQNLPAARAKISPALAAEAWGLTKWDDETPKDFIMYGVSVSVDSDLKTLFEFTNERWELC